ncbi:MAG: fasciclin domain-containing protein, partial [Burkholderiaceae bacterium]
MKRLLQLLAAVSATALLTACGGGGGGSEPAAVTPPAPTSTTLADALSKSGNTNTMAGAANTAGLSSVLAGTQNYTLLMPDDAAMSPYAEDLAELVKTENRDALTEYVKAHMVDGKLLQEQLLAAANAPDAPVSGKTQGNAKTTIVITNLLGDELEIVLDNGVLTINGVVIGTANITASNGVLHILRGPIFRPSTFSVIKRNDTTSTLEAAVKAAGLEGALRDRNAKLTVLAPTDTAFAQLLKDLNVTAEELLANKDLLTQVLTYHVIPERILARQFKDGESIETLNGQRVIVKSIKTPGKAPAIEITDASGGVSKVTQANLRGGKGVVHLIDRVLLPTSKDIVAVAAGNPDFSILVEAVTAAGLVDTLKGKGPFTVFAPTNAAFAALLDELKVTKEALLANKPLLTSVLTYHVLPSAVFADQLSDGLKAKTVQGQEIAFALKDGKASITDANGRSSNIVATNVQATNGVVHVIDKVILPKSDAPPPPPPSDIVAIAQGNPDFSILVEAVVAAGLVDTLKGAGPFTVFAPNNAAFAALLEELKVTKDALLANKPLLTSVLTYHVLAGKVLAADLKDGLIAGTVQGQPIKFGIMGSKASITDASGRKSNIVATDVQASNGVIHVIDKVILPTSKTIVDVAKGNPSFSILVEAVVAAGLADTLSGKGPFTVFAPTNDAFAALLHELHVTKEQLLANKALLTKVLTYHVVPAQVLSTQIPFDQPVKSVQGETFTIGKDLKITDQAK